MSVITNNPELTEDEAVRAFERELRDRVISGGLPYVLVIVDPDTAEARVEQYGFEPDSLPEVFAEVARVFAAGEAESVPA